MTSTHENRHPLPIPRLSLNWGNTGISRTRALEETCRRDPEEVRESIRAFEHRMKHAEHVDHPAGLLITMIRDRDKRPERISRVEAALADLQAERERQQERTPCRVCGEPLNAAETGAIDGCHPRCHDDERHRRTEARRTTPCKLCGKPLNGPDDGYGCHSECWLERFRIQFAGDDIVAQCLGGIVQDRAQASRLIRRIRQLGYIPHWSRLIRLTRPSRSGEFPSPCVWREGTRAKPRRKPGARGFTDRPAIRPAAS